jgi:acetaldehyde dehydrogenase
MRVAIVGTGNIGTDLMEKLRRSTRLELVMFAGIDPDSPGIARAKSYGVPVSTNGVRDVLALTPRPELVFEATSAGVHRATAPLYAEEGIRVVDLTPAKIGPPVVPAVNLDHVKAAANLNLITCGGQATIPIVSAMSSVAEVAYAEIVSTIASASAGPGTRRNIDEFTQTTKTALESIGAAGRGKAIIILNPADPPILMRNTVLALVPPTVDRAALITSVEGMVRRVQSYVPGYRLVGGPTFDAAPDGQCKVSIFLEVTGAGDYLAPYAGNLDIMTAAAAAVGEHLSEPAEAA